MKALGKQSQRSPSTNRRSCKLVISRVEHKKLNTSRSRIPAIFVAIVIILIINAVAGIIYPGSKSWKGRSDASAEEHTESDRSKLHGEEHE